MTQLASQTSQHRSRRRAKTTATRSVNVRLLVATILVIGVCVPLTIVWYLYQVNQTADVFLSRATALENEQKWRKAAKYREQYLRLRPGDVEQRVRMVDNLTQVEQTPNSRKRLSALLYEALGLAPERHDLRVKLAATLLQQSEFTAANEQAQNVLESSAKSDEKRAARRILALALHARARSDDRIGVEQVATALAQALADFPGDVQLASLIANYYREHPDAIESVESDAFSIADQIMDQLVAQDPPNPNALFVRYSYRAKYNLAGAKDDLRGALELYDKNPSAPNYVVALLTAAEELRSGRDGDSATSEKYLRRVIEIAPNDPRGYIGLARLLSAAQDPNVAIQVLQQGRDAVGGDNIDINSELLAAYRNSNDLDSAESVLEELEVSIRQLLPELSTPRRLKLENYLRLERSRSQLARGELLPAIRNLKDIIAAVAGDAQLNESSDRFQALLLLARAMEQLNRWDLAVDYWETLTDEMELNSDYWNELPDENTSKYVFEERYYQLGRACLQAGQPSDAIERLNTYLETSTSSADGYLLLLRSHLVQQMRRPSSERDWSEFVRLLQTFKEQTPDRWERIALESDYLLALGTEKARRTALMLLRASEKRFPKEKDSWANLALVYQRLGESQNAERALRKYADLESDTTRQLSLRAEFLARENKIDEADQVLSKLLPTLNESERVQLSQKRVRLLVSAGKLADAERLITEAITSNPQKKELLIARIEIALLRKDFKTAARCEQELATSEPFDDFTWRFLRARRLLGQFDSLDPTLRHELANLVHSLRTERPRWHPIAALAGAYAERRGNRRQAITELKIASELGDNSMPTIGRLVRLLESEGRYNESQSYLARLTIGQAASLLESLVDQAGLDETTHHFFQAQGYELRGDRDAALLAYKAAIDRDPKRVDIRLRYARLLMSSDIAAAREQYSEILKLDAGNVAAKRQFATLLAATGRDDDWNQAFRLLQSTVVGNSRNTVNDYQLRAVLLTRKGKTQEERLHNLKMSRRILTEQLNRVEGGANDIDRLLITGIAEQEAVLSDDLSVLEEAREELRLLLDRDTTSTYYHVLYVKFLIRHAQSQLVEKIATSNEYGANIRETYLSDARIRLDELDALVKEYGPTSRAAITAIGLRVDLLMAEGRQDEAVRVLDEFAGHQEGQIQQDSDGAVFYLSMGNLYSKIEQHASAEKSYRRLMSFAPNSYVMVVRSLASQGKVRDAAELCLGRWSEKPAADVAAVLAQLVAMEQVDSETDQRIQNVIASARKTYGDDVNFLMSVAVMYVTRNEYDLGIEVFQEILKIAPKNTVALNNLATLLAEHPDRHAEALDCIDRAMNIAGRNPALLDTQGTILLNAGKFEEAVACLREATAGGAADPRYYFHLALAYQGTGDDISARDALQLAQERGLDKAILTEGDREQLAALKQHLLTSTK